jgi:hypothetical protein
MSVAINKDISQGDRYSCIGFTKLIFEFFKYYTFFAVDGPFMIYLLRMVLFHKMTNYQKVLVNIQCSYLTKILS